MKKVFLNLSLLSPVMESSPVFSNWSSIFDYKFIYMGRMGVTLNTAHDTAQTHTPVRVCTDGTNSYQWYTKKAIVYKTLNTNCTLLLTIIPGFLPDHTR